LFQHWGFLWGTPQKWGFGWDGASSDPKTVNRNNTKDLTLNNLILGYSLTLVGTSQVCKKVKSKNWISKTNKNTVFKSPQKITQMVPYKNLISGLGNTKLVRYLRLQLQLLEMLVGCVKITGSELALTQLLKE